MCATVSWGAHESFMHPIFVLKNGCDRHRGRSSRQLPPAAEVAHPRLSAPPQPTGHRPGLRRLGAHSSTATDGQGHGPGGQLLCLCAPSPLQGFDSSSSAPSRPSLDSFPSPAPSVLVRGPPVS
jgi:hypothetical protein